MLHEPTKGAVYAGNVTEKGGRKRRKTLNKPYTIPSDQCGPPFPCPPVCHIVSNAVGYKSGWTHSKVPIRNVFLNLMNGLYNMEF